MPQYLLWKKTLAGASLAIFTFSSGALAQDTSSGTEADKKTAVVLSLAGVFNEKIEEDPIDQENKKLNAGGAILVEGNFRDKLGIETGVIVIKRQYDIEAAGFHAIQEVTRIHIPVMARFWPADFVSLGAGPYVSFRTEDPQLAFASGVAPALLNTSANDDVEFGLDLAVTFNLAVSDKSGLFVEGRYTKPFGEENNEDADVFSALAGVKFNIDL